MVEQYSLVGGQPEEAYGQSHGNEELPRWSAEQSGSVEEAPSWLNDQFSAVDETPLWSASQPGAVEEAPLWLTKQSGKSGTVYETPLSSASQPCVVEEAPLWLSEQAGAVDKTPLWSASQPGAVEEVPLWSSGQAGVGYETPLWLAEQPVYAGAQVIEAGQAGAGEAEGPADEDDELDDQGEESDDEYDELNDEGEESDDEYDELDGEGQESDEEDDELDGEGQEPDEEGDELDGEGDEADDEDDASDGDEAKLEISGTVASAKVCSQCGTVANSDDCYCAECGAEVVKGRLCVCQHWLPFNNGYCSYCGRQIVIPPIGARVLSQSVPESLLQWSSVQTAIPGAAACVRQNGEGVYAAVAQGDAAQAAIGAGLAVELFCHPELWWPQWSVCGEEDLIAVKPSSALLRSQGRLSLARSYMERWRQTVYSYVNGVDVDHVRFLDSFAAHDAVSFVPSATGRPWPKAEQNGLHIADYSCSFIGLVVTSRAFCMFRAGNALGVWLDSKGTHPLQKTGGVTESGLGNSIAQMRVCYHPGWAVEKTHAFWLITPSVLAGLGGERGVAKLANDWFAGLGAVPWALSEEMLHTQVTECSQSLNQGAALTALHYGAR